MDQKYSNLKEEIMDLFGVISIEEIISNRSLARIMRDITKSFGITSNSSLKTKE